MRLATAALVLAMGLGTGLAGCGQNGSGSPSAGQGGTFAPMRSAGTDKVGVQQAGVQDAPVAELKPEHAVIGDPGHEDMNQTAPDEYEVLFHTTAGDFTVHVTRDWAPLGADRFYNLVANGYFDGTKFFRVVEGFVVQWGLHGEPAVNAAWRTHDDANIQDDPIVASNTRGTITFANAGPNTRSTQVFINFADNTPLDDPVRMRGSVFAPFGVVTGDGMEVVDSIEDKYGQRPDQGRIHTEGNAYLDETFPDLDHIISATLVEADGGEGGE